MRKNKNNKINNNAGDTITKKLTIPLGLISSTAGGVIAVNTFTAALVQSIPASEWASFAARYQQFRVKRVRTILEPMFPGSGTPVTAVAVGHGALFVSDFIGTAVPASSAQILSDEGSIIVNTSKKVDYKVDWTRNPNAKLWNPTSAALPAANSYGIAFATDATASLVASGGYYTQVGEWIVEFRGSQ